MFSIKVICMCFVSPFVMFEADSFLQYFPIKVHMHYSDTLSSRCNPTLCVQTVMIIKKFDEHNEDILKVLYETELKFCSELTSFCSQTWLLLLVCLGKCFALRYPKNCCSL